MVEGIEVTENTLRGVTYYNLTLNARIVATLYCDTATDYRVFADNSTGQVEPLLKSGTGVINLDLRDVPFYEAAGLATTVAMRAAKRLTGRNLDLVPGNIPAGFGGAVAAFRADAGASMRVALRLSKMAGR